MSDQTNSAPSTTPPSAGTLLSDNLPQQVSLSGQHYIELVLDPRDFIATRTATQPPTHQESQ
jgi:hypothetical protein